MEVNETCIEVTSMSFYGPPCLLELSYTTHFFIQRCCCKFFVLPLFSLIFARFSSVPMKLQDGSSSLKRLFSAKFLKKMSKNQKEVPRAKNTKDFSEKQRRKNPGNSWFKLFPKQIPIWKYVWHIPLHYSSTHDLLQPLFLTFLEQQLPSLVMTQNLIFKSVCICS